MIPTQNSSLAEIAQQLTAARCILALCHVDPDGDAIGSLLGLGWLLRGLPGKRTVVLACQDTPPENLRFLPGVNEIRTDPPLEPWDLIVTVDASDERRLGEPFAKLRRAGSAAPVLVIDHHITNTYFGAIHHVNPGAAATAQILADLASELGVPVSPNAATCLLAGLLTDTLGFRTTNTTAATLATAMRLVEAGGNLAEIAQRTLSDRPAAILQLWGAALSGLRLADGVISVAVSQAMRKAAGVPGEDTGELVSQLITANEANLAAVFNEISDHAIKVSMRARRGYDVAQLAVRLGGGGHPQAAGCTLNGSLSQVQARVLPLLASISRQGENL